MKAEKEEIEAKVGGLECDLRCTKERLEHTKIDLGEAEAKLAKAQHEISINQELFLNKVSLKQSF